MTAQYVNFDAFDCAQLCQLTHLTVHAQYLIVQSNASIDAIAQ